MATKRSLATKLGVVAGFENPRAALEQYPTPPDLAAHVVHLADLQGDVDGRTVLDLGAGTGMFALAAALRGPARVVGVELDRTALTTARDNERRVAASAPVHWIQGDATRAPVAFREPVTVVMNPPFGARDGNRNADRAFLATASELASVSYSVHNAGSRDFLEAFAADNGGEVTHAFAADFAVDAQFDHHAEESRDLDVEVYRIEWR
ncbi:METTL5 family protein [Halorubrum halodurans]|uniref:RNA methyltransferase n=1 Tax=Halorubrum halodurans TaxID=1383851 RepID=A0A256IJY5_9EURY|nr:METTL5 family protein [Halorubrum halodurans]OYR56834.1 RNA methyltransferase [Halorubrum halodurans]